MEEVGVKIVWVEWNVLAL